MWRTYYIYARLINHLLFDLAIHNLNAQVSLSCCWDSTWMPLAIKQRRRKKDNETAIYRLYIKYVRKLVQSGYCWCAHVLTALLPRRWLRRLISTSVLEGRHSTSHTIFVRVDVWVMLQENWYYFLISYACQIRCAFIHYENKACWGLCCCVVRKTRP
jgi:hypothetical protein